MVVLDPWEKTQKPENDLKIDERIARGDDVFMKQEKNKEPDKVVQREPAPFGLDFSPENVKIVVDRWMPLAESLGFQRRDIFKMLVSGKLPGFSKEIERKKLFERIIDSITSSALKLIPLAFVMIILYKVVVKYLGL